MTNLNDCYTTTLTDTETDAHDGECKACGEPCDVGEDYCAGCDEDIALHVDWSADAGSVPWHVENVDAVA